MSCPGVTGKRLNVRDHRGNGIQVDVLDQLQEVGLVVTKRGLVPVLEEMPHTVVATIEARSIARKQRPHRPMEGLGTGLHEQMDVIRHQCPGKDPERPCLREAR